MLLRLLEDKNGEVQNLAVKWWVLHVTVKHFHLMCKIIMDSVNKFTTLTLIVFLWYNKAEAQGIF
jgi:hypothetical protein